MRLIPLVNPLLSNMLLPLIQGASGGPEAANSIMTSKTVKLQRIGSRDFEALADQSVMEAPTREMARLVLVDGLTMQQVADRFGVSRQRVSLAVEVIRRIHQQGVGVTRSGWVRVDLALPEVLSVQLGEFVAALQEPGVSQEAQAVALAHLGKAILLAKTGLQDGR